MEHNWNLQELHIMKASINREIEEIKKAQLNELYQHLDCVEKLITDYKDGYIYWICIRSYGSITWMQVYNREIINNMVDEYGSGYDGILDIYSNNPRLIRRVGEDTGRCDSYYTLEELPEEKREKYAGNPYYAGMNSVLETMLKTGE
jgi:hypothetical protein